MSADLYVQSPYNTQSFNRYNYAFNNPLSLVDPTGYSADLMQWAMASSYYHSTSWSFFTSYSQVQMLDVRTAEQNAQQSDWYIRNTDYDWLYVGNEAHNIAGGSLGDQIAAQIKGSIAGLQGGGNSNGAGTGMQANITALGTLGSYGGMGMMPYTPGGGNGTTGVQNLTFEQQKPGVAIVVSNLITAGAASGLTAAVNTYRATRVASIGAVAETTANISLQFGKNAKGHLIKHADALGISGKTSQDLQKMLPQLKDAAANILKNANPNMTRVGQWHQHQNARMYASQGKMIVTKSNGTFITVINKTTNKWYHNATGL